MAPIPIIDLLVAGLQLCFPGAHVNQQVQIPVQQLHCEVISLQLPARLLLFRALRSAVAEEQESAGLCGAEVKGDGACLLCVPFGQRDVGLGGLEGDGVQRCHIFTTEHKVAVQGNFGVPLDGQPGKLELEVIVLVHHLKGCSHGKSQSRQILRPYFEKKIYFILYETQAAYSDTIK